MQPRRLDYPITVDVVVPRNRQLPRSRDVERGAAPLAAYPYLSLLTLSLAAECGSLTSNKSLVLFLHPHQQTTTHNLRSTLYHHNYTLKNFIRNTRSPPQPFNKDLFTANMDRIKEVCLTPPAPSRLSAF